MFAFNKKIFPFLLPFRTNCGKCSFGKNDQKFAKIKPLELPEMQYEKDQPALERIFKQLQQRNCIFYSKNYTSLINAVIESIFTGTFPWKPTSDRKLLVLLDSTHRIAQISQQYSSLNLAKTSIYDIEWPSSGGSSSYDLIWNCITNWLQQWSENSTIFIGISQFCLLCWHGFVDWKAIGFLMVEDAGKLTQQHIFTKVFKFFYFPLKSEFLAPRIIGFYPIQKSFVARDCNQLQNLSMKLRFAQRELDCHCEIVDDERMSADVANFFNEDIQSYPTFDTSLISYSSWDHLVLLINEKFQITCKLSVCLVAKDSYHATKLFSDLCSKSNSGISGWIINEMIPGAPLNWSSADGVVKKDLYFFREWDASEDNCKFVIIQECHLLLLLSKNISIDKIWFTTGVVTNFLGIVTFLKNSNFYNGVILDFFIENSEESNDIIQWIASESLERIKLTLFNSKSECSKSQFDLDRKSFQYYYGSWIYANENFQLKKDGKLLEVEKTGAIVCYWNAVEILTRFCSCLPKFSSGEVRSPSFTTSIVGTNKNPDLTCCYFITEVQLPIIKDFSFTAYHFITSSSIKGLVSANKKEALMSAAYEACMLLVKNNLLCSNLLPVKELDVASKDAESKFTYQTQSYNALFFTPSEPVPIDHMIPKVFQMRQFSWNHTFYLYSVETFSDPSKASSSNSDTERTKFHQFMFNLFPPTEIQRYSSFTVGILTLDKLPLKSTTFPLSIPSPHPMQPKLHCKCQVTEIGSFTFDSEAEYYRMLEKQFDIYQFLISSIQSQEHSKYLSSSKGEHPNFLSNIQNEQKLCYFLVPLTRALSNKKSIPNPIDFEGLFHLYVQYQSFDEEKFRSAENQNQPSFQMPWTVDYTFFENESLLSLDKYHEYLHLWYTSNSFDEATWDAFFNFCCKLFYFVRSYNPSFCKFSGYSSSDFPLSPFSGSKSHPHCKTFADFYRLKYNLSITDFQRPLVKYKFIKTFEKHLLESSSNSPYVAPTIRSIPVKKSPHSSSKQSLIPEQFFSITQTPVPIIKIIQLIPSVIHRLIQESLSFELYSTLTLSFSNFKYSPSSSLTFQALSFPTANDQFNYERLEFLGDTVLKFAATLDVFDRFPSASESVLTSHRQSLISNASLYPIALKNNFDWYIYTLPFNSKLWTPPHIHSLYGDSVKERAFVYFNDNYYWNLRASFIHSMASRHLSTEMDEDGNIIVNDWIPEKYSKGRRQVAYTSKNMADVVEAFIGACFVGSRNAELESLPCCSTAENVEYYDKLMQLNSEAAYTDALQSLVALGIIQNNLLSTPNSLSQIKNELTDSPEVITLDGLIQIESVLNYKFNHPLLLQQAYTSPCIAVVQTTTNNYERLEFLGDAILDLLAVEYFYFSYPTLPPNRLSECKMILTNNLVFGTLLVIHNLHLPIISYLPPEVSTFQSHIQTLLASDNAKVPIFYEMTMDCPKVLGDLFESIAGAVWLDCNFSMQTFRSVFWPLLHDFASANANPSRGMPSNPVGRFLAAVQSFGISNTEVTCQWEVIGVGEHRCSVVVRDRIIASAVANGKPLARKLAMAEAITNWTENDAYKQFLL